MPDWFDFLRHAPIPGLFLQDPPRDEVLLSPGQVRSSIRTHKELPSGQPLGEQAAGIYAAPRPQPAGDVVLPPSEELAAIFNPNLKYTIWPSAAKRMWDDLQIQNKLGTLDDDFKKFFYRSPQDELLRGFGEQSDIPSYLKRIGYTRR